MQSEIVKEKRSCGAKDLRKKSTERDNMCFGGRVKNNLRRSKCQKYPKHEVLLYICLKLIHVFTVKNLSGQFFSASQLFKLKIPPFLFSPSFSQIRRETLATVPSGSGNTVRWPDLHQLKLQIIQLGKKIRG